MPPPPFPWAERARLSREAHAAFRDAFATVRRRNDMRDPATVRWHEAIRAHGASVDACCPPEFWAALDEGRIADHADLFTDFLEADPIFFRSGYLKTHVIRRLKRVAFTPAQRARLQAVVLNRVRTRWGREFPDYARLALRLDDPGFRDRLAALTTTTHRQPVRRRAARILATLPEHPGGPPRNWRRAHQSARAAGPKGHTRP